MRCSPLLLSVFLASLAASLQASIVISRGEKPSHFDRLTLALGNLSNPLGVLATGQKCDFISSQCDSYVIVSLGTHSMGDDLLSELTAVHRNRNNLPFVFFNESIQVNESLPESLHLRLIVMDDHMAGDQMIGEFSQELRLAGSEPTRVWLSHPNGFVSLFVELSISCARFYHGPRCTEFCREDPGLIACTSNGKPFCLDGTRDCFLSLHERASVAAATENTDLRRTIIYWVIPGGCGAVLLLVLLALLVRRRKLHADKMIVNAALQSEWAAEQQEQQQQQQAGVCGPAEGAPPQQSSLLAAAAGSDCQKFRNPVYSALRTNAGAARNTTTTTLSTTMSRQSGASTPNALLERGQSTPTEDCVFKDEVEDAADSEADDEPRAGDNSDGYEDLDAVLRRDPCSSPNETGRPLPEPGIF